jgi:hypothetical protein
VSTSLATNPGICPTSDQVTVTVFPNLSTSINDTVCDGGPYSFNGQSLTGSGTYVANLQAISGCDSTVTLNLIVSNPPNLIIADTAFCQGGTAVLSPSGALSYQWSPIVGSINANGVLTVTPNQSIDLMLIGANEFNCVDSQNVQVMVFDNPTVLLTSSDLGICPGEEVNLLASGANSYAWGGGLLAGLSGSSQLFSPIQTEIYTLIGTNLDGCSDTAALQVIVHPEPSVSVSSDTAICLGDELTLNAFGAQSYIWSNGSTGASNMINPINTSFYQVTGSNNFGCLDSDSILVTVYPLPEAIIQASPTFVYSDDPTVNFSNNSIGASE